MGILHSDHPEDCGRISLWIGLLGAPVAWLLQLQVNYALLPWACQSGNLVPLHIASAILLLGGIAAGGTAFRNWQLSRKERLPGEPAAQCRHFMALLGAASAPVFCAIIAWNWFALVLISPCV